MDYLTIKNTDLRVSRICIGGDPMGGHAWGPVNDDELLDAINVAIDNGINFFDTADVYGLGHAEELLGRALKGRRKKIVIATKFGVRFKADGSGSYYDNSPQWIREAVKGSLKRLQTDYIDIYQLHWRDGVTPISAVVEELEKLKSEGLIRYYGLSNISDKDFLEIAPYKGKFVSFQNQYSLACRDYEKDMFYLSKEMNMTPLTWGSLGQGILTGKYGRDVAFDPSDRRSRPTYPNFHGKKLLKNLDIVDKMREIGPCYGKEPAAIAIRFILDYLRDSVVIVGVKNRKQVLSNCEAADWNLSQEHVNELLEISK